MEANPAFEDEVGAPTAFGSAQATCAAVPEVPEVPVESSVESTPTSVQEVPEVSPVEITPTSAGTGTSASETSAPVTAPAEAEAPTTTPAGSLDTTVQTGEEANGVNASDEGDGDDDVCFPASATFELANESKKQMGELQIGDWVLVGRKESSQVFMFTHRAAHMWYPFVRISTRSGKHLMATGGYFMYLDGKPQNGTKGESRKRGDGWFWTAGHRGSGCGGARTRASQRADNSRQHCGGQ